MIRTRFYEVRINSCLCGIFMKEKSDRNRTIDFSLDEGRDYLEKCIFEKDPDAFSGSLMNQVIVGDCLKVMDRLPEKCVDLLIVDPPYNLAKDYHGNRFGRQSREEYRAYTVRWIEKMIPLLKDTASIYVCCDWRSSLVIGDVLHDYFIVRNRITWQREKGRGAKANWKNSMEDVWFATVGENYTFHLEDVKIRKKVVATYKVDGQPKDWDETESGNFRDTCPSNFWDDICVPYWSMPENTAHPAQKPEKLIAKMILAGSNRGDLVFDPFAGSGTTAVTAKKLGRNFIVVEQNELYAAWAQKRLEMADEDRSIQGYSGGVFWERNTFSVQKKKENRQGGSLRNGPENRGSRRRGR